MRERCLLLLRYDCDPRRVTCVARAHRHHDLSIRLVMMSCFTSSIHHTGAMSSRGKVMKSWRLCFVSVSNFPLLAAIYMHASTSTTTQLHCTFPTTRLSSHLTSEFNAILGSLSLSLSLCVCICVCVCVFRVRVSVAPM